MATVLVVSDPGGPGSGDDRFDEGCTRAIVRVAAEVVGTADVVVVEGGGALRADPVGGRGGHSDVGDIGELGDVGEPGRVDARVAEAMVAAATPVLVVRTVVPQVRRSQIEDAVGSLGGPYGDAVVGLTDDDGWWALGLASPDPLAVLGVPFTGESAGRHLLDRVHGLGLATGLLDRMVAVGSPADLRSVVEDLDDDELAALATGTAPS